MAQGQARGPRSKSAVPVPLTLLPIRISYEFVDMGDTEYFNKFGKTDFEKVMNHLNMVLAYVLSLAQRLYAAILSMYEMLNVKSRVRGDFHARFRERVEVKIHRSNRPLPP